MKISTGLLGIVAALALSAGAAAAQVVVSSKIDTEGGVLGNIILAVLEGERHPRHRSHPARRHARRAARRSRPARSTSIPNIPAMPRSSSRRADDPVWKDAAKGYAAAKQLDYDANKIVWLTPSPANNTWAIAVRKDVADANKLVTLSDFGRYVDRRRQGGARGLVRVRQFGRRPAGLPADLRVHAETRPADHPVGRRHGSDHRGRGQPDQRRQCRDGLWHRRRDRPLRALWSWRTTRASSRSISRRPIIREAVLKQYPQIETLLQPVFAKLDLVTLQELNARVQVGGEPAKGGGRGLPKTERVPHELTADHRDSRPKAGRA